MEKEILELILGHKTQKAFICELTKDKISLLKREKDILLITKKDEHYEDLLNWYNNEYQGVKNNVFGINKQDLKSVFKIKDYLLNSLHKLDQALYGPGALKKDSSTIENFALWREEGVDNISFEEKGHQGIKKRMTYQLLDGKIIQELKQERKCTNEKELPYNIEFINPAEPNENSKKGLTDLLLEFLKEKGLLDKFWKDMEDMEADYSYENKRVNYLEEAIERFVVNKKFNPIPYFLPDEYWSEIASEFEVSLNRVFVKVPELLPLKNVGKKSKIEF